MPKEVTRSAVAAPAPDGGRWGWFEGLEDHGARDRSSAKRRNRIASVATRNVLSYTRGRRGCRRRQIVIKLRWPLLPASAKLPKVLTRCEVPPLLGTFSAAGVEYHSDVNTIIQKDRLFRLGAALVCALILDCRPVLAYSYTLALDGSQTYQTIDGFGVNINHRSWSGDELKPVLNAFINQAGITQFRVIFDNMDWEAVNDNGDPNVMNWAYYNTIYDSADFQALWGIVGYLNQEGITNGIMLNFQGIGPNWMGGTKLTPGMEDECAETVASLLVYARSNQNLHFNLVGPDNEPDMPGQGIGMASGAQYTTMLHDLSVLLDANGLSDIRFVGPDRGNGDPSGYGGTNWLPDILADPVVMSKMADFGIHSYVPDGGNSIGVASLIQQSAYPARHFWMTEFNSWCQSCETDGGGTNSWGYSRALVENLLAHLANGASSAFVWEGYDSYYRLLGYWSYWGLFAVNDINATPKTYEPRQTFYTYSQVTRYVQPGAQQISLSGASAPLLALAFYNTNTGLITITGVNQDASPALLSGTLATLPAITNFELIYTSAATNLYDGGANPVTNGAFTATIPADCVFALVGTNVTVSVALTNPPGAPSFLLPPTSNLWRRPWPRPELSAAWSFSMAPASWARPMQLRTTLFGRILRQDPAR